MWSIKGSFRPIYVILSVDIVSLVTALMRMEYWNAWFPVTIGSDYHSMEPCSRT